MILWLLYIVVVVYNYLDAYQTGLLIRLRCMEANPIAAYFIEQFGVNIGLYGPKTTLMITLGILLWLYQIKRKEERI